MGERFSLRTAAAMLGVSPHTLRRWTRQRRVAFHRLGRRVVFDGGDLETFLRENRVPAAGADGRGRRP